MRVDMRNSVQCNDGNYDITNGAVAPCVNNGGVKIISNSKIDFIKLNDGLLGGITNTYKPSKFDYSGLNEMLGNVTSTKVLCNDGSIKNQQSSPTAMYGDACANNGGRAKNTFVSDLDIDMSKRKYKTGSDFSKQREIESQQNLLVGGNNLTAEDKFYESLGIKKSSGGFGIQSRPMGRILVAIVLVAGYFAYKKFKK